MGHLRLKDVLDIGSVQYAILETDGSLSVFPYPKDRPASAADAGIEARPQYLPITIIEDGYLFKKNLSLAGKDTAWVQRVLDSRCSTIHSTWLLTVDSQDHIHHVSKEATP